MRIQYPKLRSMTQAMCHLKVVCYRKFDLKNIVFIDRNMVKTDVLYLRHFTLQLKLG